MTFHQCTTDPLWTLVNDRSGNPPKSEVTPEMRALMEESIAKMETLHKIQQTLQHRQPPQNKTDLIAQVTSGIEGVWQEANKRIGQERDAAVEKVYVLQGDLNTIREEQRVIQAERDRYRRERDEFRNLWQGQARMSASMNPGQIFAQASAAVERGREQLVKDMNHYRCLAKGLQKDLGECRKEQERYNEQLKVIIPERDSIKLELENAGQSIQALKTTISELREDLTTTGLELTLCKQDLTMASKAKEQLELQLQRIQKEHQEVLETLRESQNQEMAGLRSRIIKLHDDRDVASTSLRKLKIRLDRAKADADEQLKKHESDLRLERIKLQGDANAKVNRGRHEWEAAMKELQNSFNHKRITLEEECNAKVLAFQEEQDAKTEAMKERDELMHENEELRSENISVQRDRDALEVKHRSEVEQKIQEISQVQQMNSQHIKDLQVEQTRYNQLTQANQKLKGSNDAKDGEIKQVKREYAAKFQAQDSAFEELKLAIKRCHLEDEKTRRAIDELTQQKEAHVARLKTKEHEMNELVQGKEKETEKCLRRLQIIGAMQQVSIEDRSTIHSLTVAIAVVAGTMADKKHLFDKRGRSLKKCIEYHSKQKIQVAKLQKDLESMGANTEVLRLELGVKEDSIKGLHLKNQEQSVKIADYEQANEVYRRERRLQFGYWDRSTLFADISAYVGSSLNSRIFSGRCEEEAVDVCINILAGHKEATLVIRYRDDNYMIWLGRKDDCTVFKHAWRFWIRLEKMVPGRSLYIAINLNEQVVKWLESSLTARALMEAEKAIIRGLK